MLPVASHSWRRPERTTPVVLLVREQDLVSETLFTLVISVDHLIPLVTSRLIRRDVEAVNNEALVVCKIVRLEPLILLDCIV